MKTTTREFTDEKLEMILLMCEQINAAWAQIRTTWMVYERDLTAVTPRESAAYMKEVSRHNDRISDLQLMFNTFIVTSADHPTGHLPLPWRINIQQTKLRYGKGF